MSSLGTVVDPWTQEQFPILGALTTEQAATLFEFTRPTIRSIDRYRKPVQLTDTGIVEIPVTFNDSRKARVWFDSKGRVIATAFAITDPKQYERGVLKPRTEKWAAYIRTPELRFGGDPIEFEFEHGEFSIGRHGCIPNVRQMVIDIWDEEVKDGQEDQEAVPAG